MKLMQVSEAKFRISHKCTHIGTHITFSSNDHRAANKHFFLSVLEAGHVGRTLRPGKNRINI